jgi:Tol biopolymer transport system component
LERAILHQAPAAVGAKAPIPAAMEGVIAGCLEKDPSRRRQRILNALTELKLVAYTLASAALVRTRGPAPRHALRGPVQRPVEARFAQAAGRPDYVLLAPAARFHLPQRLLSIGLVLVAVTTGLAAGAFLLSRRPAAQPMRFIVAPPENTSYPGAPSVSPDGRFLTFSALGPTGGRMLWLRPLDADSANPIPGTEGAFEPFWSADSQSIGFFADQSMKKVKIPKGPVQTLCKTNAATGGGSWNRQGAILFAPGIAGKLYRVSAEGGTPQSESTLGDGEHAHLWPQFLPDGSHFIVFVLTDIEATSGIYAGELGSPKLIRIVSSATSAVFAPDKGDSKDGYLIFLRERALVAQRFNSAKLSTQGDPVELAQNLNGLLSMSLAPVSVSTNGVLVYQSLGDASRQLLWLDRAGKQLAAVDTPGDWGPPRISPDGSRAIAPRVAAGQSKASLWLVDGAGNTTMFDTEPTHEGSPVWSPDGARVAFFANREGNFDLFEKGIAPGAKTEPLLSSPLPKYPTDWSHDGRHLLFGEISSGTRSDIWTYSFAERRASPILATVYAESSGAISPDGKWLAYQSDETGNNEVYVQPFDPTTSSTQPRWLVSVDGGSLPRWRGDGGEIFYMAPTGAMMAVAAHPAGSEFLYDKPQLLFQTRTLPKNPWNLFDVSSDGQKFLVNVPLEWSSTAPIKVVVNWNDKLRN